jgi:two-component sensor histidine kinase
MGLAAHDLFNMLNAISTLIKAAQRSLPDSDSPNLAETVATPTSCLIDAHNQVVALAKILRQLLRQHEGELFIARPSSLLHELQSAKPNLHLSWPSDPPHLHLVYPRNTLLTIILELIDNAQRFAGETASIVFDWKMEGKKFVCDVHDDGPGIGGLPVRGFVPYGTLFPPPENARRDLHGLALIEKLTISSEGMLLFGRSTLLRGTHVHFELQVPYFGKGDSQD